MDRNEKPKNPEIPQSKTLDVSTRLQHTLEFQKKVGSNASEGMDLLARQEKASKGQKLPSSVSV